MNFFRVLAHIVCYVKILTFPPTQANLLFVITKLGYQDLGCNILSIEIHLSLEDKNTSTEAVGVSRCDVDVMPPATTNANSSPYFYNSNYKFNHY